MEEGSGLSSCTVLYSIWVSKNLADFGERRKSVLKLERHREFPYWKIIKVRNTPLEGPIVLFCMDHNRWCVAGRELLCQQRNLHWKLSSTTSWLCDLGEITLPP